MHVVGKTLVLKMEKEMATHSSILYFLNFYLFICFCCAGSSLLCAWTFLQLQHGGLLSSCRAQASHCGASLAAEHRL